MGEESLYFMAKEQRRGSFVHKSASLLRGVERSQLQRCTGLMRETGRLVKGRNIGVFSGDLPETWVPPLFVPFMVWCYWSWLLVGVFSLKVGRERETWASPGQADLLFLNRTFLR